MMNVLMQLLNTLSKYGSLLVLLLAAGVAMPLQARTVFTCQDAQGERFFSERCPPGTQPVESRRFGSGNRAATPPPAEVVSDTEDSGASDVRRLQPVTVYAAPDCVPCEFVERHLESRRVAFVRVDVEADPVAFETVRSRLDKVGVPVITIGKDLLTGFQPQRIDEVLVAQGVLLATDVPARDASEQPSPGAQDETGDEADAPPTDAAAPQPSPSTDAAGRPSAPPARDPVTTDAPPIRPSMR